MSGMSMRIGEPKAPFACVCCRAEFTFSIDAGGLCDMCNAGNCPACGHDGEGWL
jgi:hypothetical protein